MPHVRDDGKGKERACIQRAQPAWLSHDRRACKAHSQRCVEDFEPGLETRLRGLQSGIASSEHVCMYAACCTDGLDRERSSIGALLLCLEEDMDTM